MLAFLLLPWLVVVNVWTFLRFGQDKRRVITGFPRIRESRLLGLAMLGGTIGAYAGRGHFEHKTRKQPFSACLHLIAVVQLAALFLAVSMFRDA